MTRTTLYQLTICALLAMSNAIAQTNMPSNRDWSPEQATGAPDTLSAGDFSTAWASLQPDGTQEWLEVTFAKPVEVAEVRIRETFNPGAISKIEAVAADQKETVLWEGKANAMQAPADMVVKPANSIRSQRIKIHVDSNRVPGWNEIDAVELVGTDGSRQWATTATASSTYADHVASQASSPPPPTNGEAADNSFAGDWKTSFGPMKLEVNGDAVNGTYQMGDELCHIEGKVEGEVMVFNYTEPTAKGQGTFTLAPDGKSFSGTWLQYGEAEWRAWAGARESEVVSKPWKSWEGLLGNDLIDVNGKKIDPTSLEGKLIGIYFSAHWCPPCRQFTPKLVEFRNAHADQFEVVFVSSDQNADDQQKYMQEAGMPWPAIPYASQQVALLKERFSISGIPSLVIVDGKGTLISTQGRSDIGTDPTNALKKWQAGPVKKEPNKAAGGHKSYKKEFIKNGFSYDLLFVNQPDADKYLVSQSHVRKYRETQQTYPVTYWGPTDNGVDANLTYKFPLKQKASRIDLLANIASFNFSQGGGSGTGCSSLWGSKDGKNWTLLLDNPAPNRIDSYKTFDSQLPDSLLGANEIWVQIRLRADGAPNTAYTTAQFARTSSEERKPQEIKPIFSIRAHSNLSEMVDVQGGTLRQGSELAGQVVDSFQIGKYEVTWGLWKEVRDWAAANRKGYDLADVGETYPRGSGDSFPVAFVSWYDALKWCNARSEKEELTPVYQASGANYKTGEMVPLVNNAANGYRLPIEKEWEWAARGGVSSKGYTYSGSNDVEAVAWTFENSKTGTQPVGAKEANELGIHDMSGNVFEWCWDQINANRRLRGGSYYFGAERSTIAVRDGLNPDGRYGPFGFRVARNLGNAAPFHTTPSTDATQTPPNIQKDPSLQQWPLNNVIGDQRDMTIATGKSIFGCPIGSSKDDVILKLGEPLVKIESGNGNVSLIYGEDCTMSFHENKLYGVKVSPYSYNFANFALYGAREDFAFGQNAKWKLSNGITQEMNLSEVKKILGDRFNFNYITSRPKIIYNEGGAQITLDIASSENPKSLADYSVWSFSIDNSFQKKPDLIIDPAKSIFGCELGSSREKVISILGKPDGEYDLGNGKTAFYYEKYGRDCAILFWNGCLGGIDMSFNEDLKGLQARRLKNGLRPGMTVDQAKAILGDKATESLLSLSYTDGRSKVAFTVDENLSFLSIRPEGYSDTGAKLSIDIGKSIFGCKMGASREQVIERLGQPTSKLDLRKGKSALAYGKKFALTFRKGKLAGLVIARKQMENPVDWSFTNGIKPGMSLADAEKRLGKKFKLKKDDELGSSFKTASFDDRPSDSSVTLLLSDKNTICDYLRIEPIKAPLSQFIEDHIKTAQKSDIQTILKDKVIVPGKSIFGLPLGAKEDAVIKKLGEPNAKREYAEGMFSLIYGGEHVLEFWDGKLGGVSLLDFMSVETDLLGLAPDIKRMEDWHWKLGNGICQGMKFGKVKKLLGNKLHSGLEGSYYEEAGSVVGLYLNGMSDPDEVFGLNIEPITKSPAIIDPDKSIFGCELGSTPEQVISHLGKPLGKLDLGREGQGMTALVYGEDCKLLFWNGHLGGVDVFGYDSDNILDILQDKYKNNAIPSPSSIGVPSRGWSLFEKDRYYVWQLKNGLRSGMTLDQAKAILGNKFPGYVENELSYKEGRSRVTFSVFDKKLGNVSIKPEAPNCLADLTIDPAKSIFGFPLGSTQDEVIARLGQPVCKLNLRKGKTALIYGSDCAFTFWDGLLGGAVLEEGLFNRDELGIASLNGFARHDWSFTNGIRPGMTLGECKKLMGNTFQVSNGSYGAYADGPSKVAIISWRFTENGNHLDKIPSDILGDESDESNNIPSDESDESKALHGIAIEPLKASLNQ